MKAKSKIPSELLTVKDVCALLSQSEVTIRRRIREGKIRVIRIGRSLRIERDSVRDFLVAAAK